MHFARFLRSDPERLHMAAHSHHPWPDASFEAHRQAWLDAAYLIDDKWEKVFGEVLPQARGHVARVLGLPDPATVVFATNTHELVVRLLSCLPAPTRILTTDAEFHSFARQARRLEEDGVAVVERVPAEPFETFEARFAEAAARGGHDLVFFSHVLFDSAYVVGGVGAIVEAVPDERTFVVIDGYHGFMALPTDLGALADRAFYLAGGYKYAMAGEGACFMHCPPGYGQRPPNTGWFAGFADLEPGSSGRGTVGYPTDGMRFAGSTFDPSGLYRFNAVQAWLAEVSLDVAALHSHARGLQAAFIRRFDLLDLDLGPHLLVPGPQFNERGNFLAFRTPDAARLYQGLHDLRVITDHRGDRWRIGFGIYHDEADLDVLCDRLTATTDARRG